MDRNWIYGSRAGKYLCDASCREGRTVCPRSEIGIPEYQAWEIAAYVRAMAGLLPKGVSPTVRTR